MTYREAILLGESILQKANIVDAKNDAWLLLAMACRIDHTYYYVHMDEEMSQEQIREYQALLSKRAERIPLQYIVGEQEFMGLKFRVNSNVLIPRQDTETLVEEALKVIEPGMRVLDMCTGSGCIIISILKNTTNVDGAACDISKQALNVAKENARLNGVFVDFERSDLFEHVDEMYDVIVSNPPYIRSDEIPHLMPEVSVFEPHEALDGSEDGLLFYRRIIKDCRANLKPHGRLLFEIGCDQGRQVSQMMQFAGFSDVHVIKDLAGNDRVVSGVFDSKEENMFDKLEDLIHHYEELMNLLSEPDVANDANRFKKLMKEQSDLAPIVETYKKYKECKQNIEDSLAILDEESDEEMRELAKEELKDSKEQVEELEKELKILLLPKDPNDDKNVIVEIRAGAGGEEAALFAAEIYRMYVHYAENRGWKVETLDADETGIGGMKSVEFMVKGSGAYSILKYESGVHRVQRVPETESQGRIQTSTCSVAVMPEAEDVDVKIDDKDIRIDVMRASGNGGQCVNTTDSAVRLTHYPTGIVIYSQTEKSQIQNKEKAFALLRTKLYDLELQKKQDAEAEERRSQIGTGDRAEKIRTYNFPQGRVTDHRINLTLYKLDKILNGDIQEIIDACIAADQAKKLSNMEHDA